jgi:hypothetical protein
VHAARQATREFRVVKVPQALLELLAIVVLRVLKEALAHQEFKESKEMQGPQGAQERKERTAHQARPALVEIQEHRAILVTWGLLESKALQVNVARLVLMELWVQLAQLEKEVLKAVRVPKESRVMQVQVATKALKESKAHQVLMVYLESQLVHHSQLMSASVLLKNSSHCLSSLEQPKVSEAIKGRKVHVEMLVTRGLLGRLGLLEQLDNQDLQGRWAKQVQSVFKASKVWLVQQASKVLLAQLVPRDQRAPLELKARLVPLEQLELLVHQAPREMLVLKEPLDKLGRSVHQDR